MTKECPNGHVLGHQGKRGFCRTNWCGDPPKKAASAPQEPQEATWLPAGAPKLPKDDALAPVAQETFLAAARASWLAKMKELGVPDELAGKAAEEWADAKMVELLPSALAELEYRLKYARSDEARWSAAKQVLDSTGRGRKEAFTGGVAPILVITDLDPKNLPWAKRVTPTVPPVLEGLKGEDE